MSKDKLSVCIATYNGEKYIGDQLKSILRQLSSHDEVVISDDSSNDLTCQIIADINDSRIKLLRDQKFRSPIFNFENAIKKATGDYIFLADQDDIWLDNRISTMMTYFPEYDLVVSDCAVVDESLNIIHPSYFLRVNARTGFLRNLIRTSPYIGCCMAFKRKVATRSLPFPKTIPMHDFWIAMLAELFYKIKLIEVPLVLYRRHASNISGTASRSSNTLAKKITLRAWIVKDLAVRLLKFNS